MVDPMRALSALGALPANPVRVTRAWSPCRLARSVRAPCPDDRSVGSTVLPLGPAGRGSMLNQHMMSVASAAEHSEDGWEWCKWTCSRESSLAWALKAGAGPRHAQRVA